MTNKKSKATRRAESLAASERAAAIRKEQERKERRRRTIGVSAAVLVVLALIFGIGYGVQSSRDTTGKSGATPQGTTDTYAVSVGKPTAKVTLDVYEDFMCPICGELEAADKSWVPTYLDQGKVLIRYHVMSFLDRQSSGTEYSTRAANAFAVVTDTAGPDVAKKFHDLLYANQPTEGSAGLTDSQLIDYAVQAGAARSDVEKPIRDVAFRQWVVNATDQANKDGVNGTPTVRVDGKDFTDFTTMQTLSTNLRKLVDSRQG